MNTYASSLKGLLTDTCGIPQEGVTGPADIYTITEYQNNRLLQALNMFGLSSDQDTYIRLISSIGTQLEELWEWYQYNEPDAYVTEESFYRTYAPGFFQTPMGGELFRPDLVNMLYYHKPAAHPVQLILNKTDYDRIMSSRLYPLYTQKELDILRNRIFLLVGVSTASPIAEVLTRLGAAVIMVDPDTVAVSNNTRMVTGHSSVSCNKAREVLLRCMDLYPYSQSVAISNRLSPEQFRSIVDAIQPAWIDQNRVVISEMIDDPSGKALARQIADTVMTTGLHGAPILEISACNPDTVYAQRSIESFVRPIDQNLPKPEAAAKVRLFLSYMNGEIPLRNRIGFILFVLDKIHFISQEPITTILAASMSAEALKRAALGSNDSGTTETCDLTGLFSKQEITGPVSGHDEIRDELAERFPDVFSSTESLQDQIDKLWKKYHLDGS